MVDINIKIPLLEKMWETLDERAIATWLNPIRIKREGLAQLEVDKKRLLEMSRIQRQTERENDLEQALSLVVGTNDRIDPYVDFEKLAEAERKAEFVRKQTNLGKAIIHAEIEIEANNPDVPENAVEPDWLFRWRDYASNVSNQDMQVLWGKVLAGEMAKPGQYSLNTLNIISNLSKSMAEKFLKLASLCVKMDHLVIFINESIDNFPNLPSHVDLLEFQDTGLLNSSESTLNLESNRPKLVRINSDKAIILKRESDGKAHLGIRIFTKAGAELFSIVDIEHNVQYFDTLCTALAKKIAGTVMLVDLIETGATLSYNVATAKVYNAANIE